MNYIAKILFTVISTAMVFSTGAYALSIVPGNGTYLQILNSTTSTIYASDTGTGYQAIAPNQSLYKLGTCANANVKIYVSLSSTGSNPKNCTGTAQWSGQGNNFKLQITNFATFPATCNFVSVGVNNCL